jgi:hypothetical protein
MSMTLFRWRRFGGRDRKSDRQTRRPVVDRALLATPTPSSTFMGEFRLTAGKGRKKKVVAFELFFSSPLDDAAARTTGHYRVTQPGRKKRGPAKLITVRSIALGPDDRSVTLVLGKHDARRPLTLTATGLVGADGTPAPTLVTDL